jgi:serine/threonine-protein kinase
MTIGQPPSMDVWVYDIGSATLSRLTSDAHSTTPVWAPDGRHVAWTMTAGVNAGTWWRPWDASEPPRPLVPGSRGVTFSRAGDYVITNVGTPAVATIVRLDSSSRRTAIMETPTPAPNSRISPDGKWLAYLSTETGSVEVYIRPLPGPGGHYQISNGGGFEPVWSPKSNEIFYRFGTRLLVASIATMPEPHVLRRDTLFALNAPYGLVEAQYDVSPDGKHIIAPASVVDDSPPILMIGWVDELRRRPSPSTKP